MRRSLAIEAKVLFLCYFVVKLRRLECKCSFCFSLVWLRYNVFNTEAYQKSITYFFSECILIQKKSALWSLIFISHRNFFSSFNEEKKSGHLLGQKGMRRDCRSNYFFHTLHKLTKKNHRINWNHTKRGKTIL